MPDTPTGPAHDATASSPEGAQTSGPIRIVIVDDHPVVRDGLRGMLAGEPDLEVVADAANGRDAIERVRTFEPDVVLMDLRMPELDGVQAIRALRERGVTARVLVLTTYDTDHDVLAAIEAGATGYLLKDTPRDELFQAIRAAARGERSIAPSVADHLDAGRRVGRAAAVSPRELEILRHIAAGATNQQIARQLFISEATVKTHLQHTYDKLGVNDRAAAVATAYERGLLGDRNHAG
jgi:DNA-binding NarL/FixJ family response regulator